MAAYWDTSVLAKIYVDEPGSDLVRKLLGGERPVTSAICPVEMESMLRRSHAEGRLTEEEQRGARAMFALDLDYWSLMDVDAAVLQQARLVAADFPIRALDAVHVASALRLRERFPDTAFLTADVRQGAVAAALGFRVSRLLPQA
ncbi:MAG TPA: type II toxin-antitoxin system VapC family toxin [Terriglobales bacterium]|nr:type II toxin-antitoxin system VapC family toxin [Terriglobales bacterium]